MILLDLINLQKIKKAILYLLCAAIALWLQMDVFSRVAPMDVKPFFIPVIPAIIGLWEGGVWGGIFGLLTGLYCDMNYAESTVRFLILFSAFGFFAGVLGEYFINRRFFASMLLSAGALAVTTVFQIVPLWIFRGVPLATLLPVAGLQALWSLPFAVPAYLAIKSISGRAKFEDS